MQLFTRRSLSLTGAAALALAAIPQVNAKPVEMAQGSADDLGVMGISREELIPGIDYGGVATYLGDAARSKVTLFI